MADAARMYDAWVALHQAAIVLERALDVRLRPWNLSGSQAAALGALVAHVRAGGAKRLAVERFDGEPIVDSEVMPLLVEHGFLAGPRRAVLRP